LAPVSALITWRLTLASPPGPNFNSLQAHCEMSMIIPLAACAERRSLTSTMTVSPFSTLVTLTRVPTGIVACAAVSALGLLPLPGARFMSN
jgi:hypothetical protein